MHIKVGPEKVKDFSSFVLYISPGILLALIILVVFITTGANIYFYIKTDSFLNLQEILHLFNYTYLFQFVIILYVVSLILYKNIVSRYIIFYEDKICLQLKNCNNPVDEFEYMVFRKKDLNQKKAWVTFYKSNSHLERVKIFDFEKKIKQLQKSKFSKLIRMN